jgi:KUP system potassium uptake protein
MSVLTKGSTPGRASNPARAALTLAALGVVFGDIGTSPIYTIQTAFSPDDPHPVTAATDAVYGIVSLIFWSVTIIVTVKYVLLVLRADNQGEGGILSLMTLVTAKATRGSTRAKAMLAGLGLFGASLFFGDSMITPAISVLSAVEGIKVVEPSFDRYVVPVTAVIIVLLFAAQRYGTAKVGRLFGPVMVLWFLTIGALGIWGISKQPKVLGALSPTHAVEFMVHDFGTAFFALAAVVLAITGAEALYADLGHFGRAPITRAWLGLVFPACVLSYLGQGALILDDASAIRAPFFLLVPDGMLIPLVVLATAATVIASQAVITGAFSVARQAVQLGYLPRLRILHTSEETLGQIYVPWINWVLMVSVLVLVFSFRSSAELAYAFGMAVTGTVTITTVLFFYLVRHRWGTPLWLVLTGAGVFLTVELLFLAANLTKLSRGAWLPLLIAVLAFTVLTTWQRGRAQVTRRRERHEGRLRAFVDELHELQPPLRRTPGTAVFLNRDKITAPLAMRANVEHNHVLHEHVVVLSVETMPVPVVDDEHRIQIDNLGHSDDGIVHVNVRTGYMETPDVPAALHLARQKSPELDIEPGDTSYFVSMIELRVSDEPGMARWRKRLFVSTSTISADAADYFGLPRDRTVIMGSQIEV